MVDKTTATNIINYLGFSEYEITDIYESSFRALRKNEYMLSELNVELYTDRINANNVYEMTNTCIHVLKRYN